MKAEQSKTGRYYAGNRSWPAMNRVDYEVKIDTIKTFESEAEAIEVQAKLEEILKPYSATVSVTPVQVVFLAPDDLAEFLAEYRLRDSRASD